MTILQILGIFGIIYVGIGFLTFMGKISNYYSSDSDEMIFIKSVLWLPTFIRWMYRLNKLWWKA